jgi:hypothetical protein
MSHADQRIELKRRKRKFPTVEEIARQYYMLAKATMADRNVSSIYTICLDDLGEDESSGDIKRFRRKVNSLAESDSFETVILDSRDLSIKDKNELTQLVNGGYQDNGSKTSQRPKEYMDRLYFQLQRARVPKNQYSVP